MTHRMIAVVALLAVAGSTFAQPLPPGPAGPPPAAAPAPAAEPAFSFEDLNFGMTGPVGQGWVTADYMIAWISGPKLPPLATTSPPGTPRQVAGVLPDPETSILFDGYVNDEVRAGIKLAGGYWMDAERTRGFEAGAMFLESKATIFSAASGGTPILARPYIDARHNSPSSVLIAFPGASSGSLDIRASSGNFYEAHIGLAETIASTTWFRLNAIAGYRFYRYDEGLILSQVISPIGGGFTPGTSISSTDNFATENTFNGGDMGVRAQFGTQALALEVLGKVAIGNMNREVQIRGNSVTRVPGQDPVPQTGGVYALVSNNGTFRSNDWAVMPEIGVTLRWQMTPQFGVRVGYSAIFLDAIARPSDQIDFQINPDLFPPATGLLADPFRPTFRLQDNSAWLQNVTFGAELTF